KYVFYSMDLRPQVETPPLPNSSAKPPVPHDFRLELAGDSDLKHIMAARPFYYTEEHLKKRFQAGHMCFLGWIKNEPVHLRWHFINSLYLPYLKRTLRLANQEVWADEAYTHPVHRRSGIYAYAGNLITRSLAEMNYQRLSCAFASWNASPQRIALERGMKRIGEVVYYNYIIQQRFVYSGLIHEGEGNSIEIGEKTLQNSNEQRD
ncbi:MAG: hypothetical protein GQ544_08280, partial [Candidatus Aminicenantes bacterium]|nr:hypothetical protein [Candidatus Aminicenantes bacterium]